MLYKQLIEKYYSASFLDSFLSDTNEQYKNAKKEKEKFTPIWNDFVSKVKNIEEVKKVRDTYYSSHPDTGKVTIGINNNVEESLTFNLSFRTMQMGIYYCHYSKKHDIPIVEQYRKAVDGTLYQTIYHHLSYFPFNKLQEEFAWQLVEIAYEFFPNFKLFNNIFAAKKASNVIIQNEIFNEYDYFRVIFDNAMDGIS